MSFGENLRFLRMEAGLTQEQFAEKMEVTRQSVSKWESDNGFPEMEKLIQIREQFDCSLDDLLYGNVQEKKQTDTIGYNAHMTRRTWMITIGVVLCTMSVMGVSIASYQFVGVACLIPGVLLLVLSEIWHHQFREEYPQLIPFYKKEELSAARRRYPFFMVCGIGVILSALMVWTIRYIWHTTLMNGIASILVGLGVGILVYGGMEHQKYKIEQSGQISFDISGKSDRWCSVIMLTATIIFLLYLFLGSGNGHSDVARVAAATYATGAILCTIIKMFQNKDNH